jgi:Na+/H+ antiporter NhaD/arsenite permease-like protein
MAAPAVVAIGVPCAVIAIVARSALAQRYAPAPQQAADDRALFWISAAVVAVLLPLLVSGLPVWIPATVAAATLLAAFAIRRRGALRFSLLPWQLVLFAAGLFLVVEAGHGVGLADLSAQVAGRGEDPGSLLRLAFAGMVSSNAIDNLPAYLALEPTAGSPIRIGALLIGVNAGAIITPWGSLATLLWHQRLVALGVELRWSRYVLLGVAVAPATVALATLALAYA